jgi:hypothetical protein
LDTDLAEVDPADLDAAGGPRLQRAVVSGLLGAFQQLLDVDTMPSPWRSVSNAWESATP